MAAGPPRQASLGNWLSRPAPATSSTKGTAKTTGSGVGACAIRCCSPTTLPTPLGRAITTRIGSSSKCHMANRRRGSIPQRKIPPTSALVGSNRNRQETYPQSDQTGPWRVYGRGRANTWTINFDMDHVPQGQATLRVAPAGSDGGGGLTVGVNGKEVGTIRTISTNALRYNTNKGVWRQYTQTFDARTLEAGRKFNDSDGPSGRTYHRRRLRLHASGAPRGLKSSLPSHCEREIDRRSPVL